MTFGETLLSGVVLVMITALITLISTNKNKVTEEDFKKHKEGENPHVACPVHKSKMDDIEKKIDKMDGKLDRLLER